MNRSPAAGPPPAFTLERVSVHRSGTGLLSEISALGLPASAAFAPHARSALRTALMPVIDATKVVGLISLPGATTGLILAGVDPLVAIRYQIVVMYMQLGAAALAAVTSARPATSSLFDEAHRMRPLDGVRT